MSQSWFVADHEVAHPGHPTTGPKLVFQWGRYRFKDPERPAEEGYRFAWRLANGKLQSRGPARLPSIADITLLTDLATKQGWGGHAGPGVV